MRGNHSPIPLAAVLLATLAGCASGPSYPGYQIYPETVPPPMAPKEKDAAAKTFPVSQVSFRSNVYVYRTGTEPMTLMVTVNEVAVGELPPRSFFVLTMGTIKHSINAFDERIAPPKGGAYMVKKGYFGTPSTFTPEPSKNVYIKVTAKPYGVAGSSPVADIDFVTDEKKAQEEIRLCNLVERGVVDGY